VMKRVLLTGMSGTGKSTVINELAARGYKAVDTDDHGLSEWVAVPLEEPTGLAPGQDWVWREDRIQELLSSDDVEVLFLSGCSPNQGKFYPQFEHIVLLTAPPAVLVERLANRTTNPYGKHPDEVAQVLALQQTVEPLLRGGAGLEVDTSAPLDQVVATVLRLVHSPPSVNTTGVTAGLLDDRCYARRAWTPGWSWRSRSLKSCRATARFKHRRMSRLLLPSEVRRAA
jgi:shikimate kinase